MWTTHRANGWVAKRIHSGPIGHTNWVAVYRFRLFGADGRQDSFPLKLQPRANLDVTRIGHSTIPEAEVWGSDVVYESA